MVRYYSLKDVAEHSTRESPWFIIKNKVYDVTKLLDQHLGGPSILLMYAGKDATGGFYGRDHSDKAVQWMKEFEIGELGPPPKKWWQCPLCYCAAGIGVAALAVIVATAVVKSKH